MTLEMMYNFTMEVHVKLSITAMLLQVWAHFLGWSEHGTLDSALAFLAYLLCARAPQHYNIVALD